MSDRPREQGHPAASAAASRPTADDATSSAVASPNTPNEPYPRPSYTSASAPGSRTVSRQSSIHLRAVELPPLPRLPNVSGGSFSPASRSAGVASILNPIDANDAVGEGRRRKASQMMESSGPAANFLPPPAMNESGPAPPSHGPAASPMSIASALGDRAPRRILTPRSPSIHRATSLTQLNPPSATINAQQSPFMGSPRSKTYTLEPGTGGVPPMPTPPANLRHGYGFPQVSSPVHSARRASTGATHPPQPPSESTSPTSSYGQPGHGSPGAHHTPAPLPRAGGHYGELSGGAHHEAQQRSASIPMLSTSSSAAYQMMTISTSSGPVHLPVDMQAASRVADEKRRRNAGASARFRQRRKEKEKEASTMISRLEQQVKELTEDLAYYKRERELMATALLQAPGGDRHFPRPPSPRQRRISNPMQGGGPPSGSGAMYNPIHDQPGRSPDEGRNVRRRVSALPLPPPPPPQQQGQLPNPGAPYQPPPQTHQGYGPPLAPHPAPPAQHGPPTLSRPSLPAPTSAGGPPSLMHAPPQTGPWNPYAHDRRGPAPLPPGTTTPTSRDGR